MNHRKDKYLDYTMDFLLFVVLMCVIGILAYLVAHSQDEKNIKKDLKIVCINGSSYAYDGKYATLVVGKDGDPIPCKPSKNESHEVN